MIPNQSTRHARMFEFIRQRGQAKACRRSKADFKAPADDAFADHMKAIALASWRKPDQPG